jgi:hypothetical protein
MGNVSVFDGAEASVIYFYEATYSGEGNGCETDDDVISVTMSEIGDGGVGTGTVTVTDQSGARLSSVALFSKPQIAEGS